MKLPPAARVSVGIFALVYICTATSLVSGQPIPSVDEENLNGQKVVLPDAAAGKVAVLVIGFTRASKAETRAWAQRIEPDLGKATGFELYSLPILEEVPRMIRGMVISGMKHDVPERERARFVPVLHNETEWKKVVNYKEPDDPYLVVLDRTGNIAYQLHGGLNDQNYSRLRQRVEALLKP